MRVVLDTNVVMSGIYFGGQPAAILTGAAQRRCELVASTVILDEYLAVNERLSRSYADAADAALLSLIVDSVTIVTPTELSEQICDDPDDDIFFACALAARSVVVSGDRALRRASGYQAVEVLSPRSFLARFG